MEGNHGVEQEAQGSWYEMTGLESAMYLLSQRFHLSETQPFGIENIQLAGQVLTYMHQGMAALLSWCFFSSLDLGGEEFGLWILSPLPTPIA